jgi:hypothetical protein
MKGRCDKRPSKVGGKNSVILLFKQTFLQINYKGGL